MPKPPTLRFSSDASNPSVNRMERGRLYPQIGERWIDPHNVNNWPPRRCALNFLTQFDGIDETGPTPVVPFTLRADRLGVEYHATMLNSMGRLWSIDWGLRIDDTATQGMVRSVSIIDNPSGQQIQLESDPYESTAGFPFWLPGFTWLPLAVTIRHDPRFSGLPAVFGAAEQYF